MRLELTFCAGVPWKAMKLMQWFYGFICEASIIRRLKVNTMYIYACTFFPNLYMHAFAFLIY